MCECVRDYLLTRLPPFRVNERAAQRAAVGDVCCCGTMVVVSLRDLDSIVAGRGQAGETALRPACQGTESTSRTTVVSFLSTAVASAAAAVVTRSSRGVAIVIVGVCALVVFC